MKFTAIYRRTATGYSAHIPDLPGCVAAGDTIEETERLMRGALAMHLTGMREDGETIPLPTTVANHNSAIGASSCAVIASRRRSNP